MSISWSQWSENPKFLHIWSQHCCPVSDCEISDRNRTAILGSYVKKFWTTDFSLCSSAIVSMTSPWGRQLSHLTLHFSVMVCPLTSLFVSKASPQCLTSWLASKPFSPTSSPLGLLAYFLCLLQVKSKLPEGWHIDWVSQVSRKCDFGWNCGRGK